MATTFRRKTFEKIYTVEKRPYFIVADNKFEDRLKLCSDVKEISDDVLYTSILSNTFNVGEKVYLEEMDEFATIKEIIKSTKGDTVYYVTDKIIETENTLQSKQLTELQVANDNLQKKFNFLQNKFEDYKREYKYKHRFFNIW